MSNEPFSETPYYDEYKAIRNRLRAYNPVALIGMCLQYLHKPVAKPMDYIERHPWCVLLLIKWILVDEKFADRNRPAPTQAQTVKLVQQMINLAGKVRMPSEHDYITLFIRAMLFQQVLYQRRSSILLTGRQMLYFGGLDEAHYIPRTFHEVTGMSLNRFLQLALAFHTAFLDDGPVRHRIGTRWFGDLQNAGETDDIELFLGLLSDSFLGIRETLLARDAKTLEAGRKPRAASEYAEQTPLIQTPLLPSGLGDYVVIDPCLLENCLDNFIYNTLRGHHVQDFMGHFGPIFEDYVRLAVEYSRLPFRTEDELKLLLGAKQGRNLIDFVITDEDAHVFLDAKAAEMNYRGTVTYDAVELAKLLDASLLKAVKQANSVIADLVRLNSDDAVFKARKRHYLIVVTYARMNIGNGRALADAVGMTAIEAVVADQPGGLQIPIENMYFLTIEEFERLVAQVAVGSIGLVEALERAKKLDADPATSSFMFEQHLAKWGMAGTAPDYLIKKTTDALDQIAASLKQYQIPACDNHNVAGNIHW
jgi:hypothetical protein